WSLAGEWHSSHHGVVCATGALPCGATATRACAPPAAAVSRRGFMPCALMDAQAKGRGHRLLVHFQGYTTAPAMLEWRAAGELRGVWDAQRVDDFLRQQQPQQQSAAPAAHHSP